MTNRLFSVLRHQYFQLDPRALMLQKGLSGGTEDSGKFGPEIRGAHINNTDRFDPRLWRLYTKQARRLAALDTAPELPLSRDNEVLIKRIRMGGDLNPFAATGDH